MKMKFVQFVWQKKVNVFLCLVDTCASVKDVLELLKKQNLIVHFAESSITQS